MLCAAPKLLSNRGDNIRISTSAKYERFTAAESRMVDAATKLGMPATLT
jgi:hypothetical protein